MNQPSPYVQRLPIGERVALPLEGISGWSIFPFEGEVRVKRLEPPVLPEPARHGEEAGGCGECARPDTDFLWVDEHWRLKSMAEPAALPAMVMLEPRGHYDLADLPAERAAELGAMLQRVERAIMSLGGIGRVHVNKWGDGAAHLHLWLIARPEGMMQLRGTCLPLWDDVLPKVTQEEWDASNHVIATAMALDGGIAQV